MRLRVIVGEVDRRHNAMKYVIRPLAALLFGAFLVIASCSRPPGDSQESSSDKSAGRDSDANSGRNTREPSGTPEISSFVGEKPVDSDLPATGVLALDIDINSGDLRHKRSILGGAPGYVVYESELSKEVRRLGIPIPQERQWRFLGRAPSGGMDVRSAYESLLPLIKAVLDLFDEVGVADQERREALAEFMVHLRVGSPRDAVSKAHELYTELDRRLDGQGKSGVKH